MERRGDRFLALGFSGFSTAAPHKNAHDWKDLSIPEATGQKIPLQLEGGPMRAGIDLWCL